MEGDYLELSQFFYNSHQSSYNSYPSPLGTSRFLTFGIRAVDLETDEYDRQEILKDLQKMVNEVSENVKAMVESNMAMKEKLLRLQEDLENITEEELQSLNSMKLEEQIMFKESTTVVTSRDVDFWVKVDDDIYVRAAFEVQSKEPTKKVNIAIDVATALDYLHHDCDPPVVHCDLKPENVLLDEDMTAHVGDFGLARFFSHDSVQNESSTIGLKGSIGYIAPEYGLGGKASTSGDVYSFGILLLEMIIAKKPTDRMFQEGLSLNKFVSEMHECKILDITDPRLFKDIESLTRSSSTSHSIGREQQQQQCFQR